MLAARRSRAGAVSCSRVAREAQADPVPTGSAVGLNVTGELPECWMGQVTNSEDLARAYATAVSAADMSAVTAEPEAQLTVPVVVLLESFAKMHGLGSLQLLREAQLPGVRPDFA